MSRRKTILLVDDMLANIQFFRALMGEEYDVIYALSGEEGLKVAIKKQPDIILLDVMMPDLDGYEVCRRLKSNPRSMSIPVIFLTILDHVEDEQIGLEAGAIDFITKPYHAPLLKAKINNLIGYKEMLKEAYI